MRKIDLEAHFLTESYVNYMRSRNEAPRLISHNDHIEEWLSPDIKTKHSHEFEQRFLNLGEPRIKEMDEAGIDVQVLSLTLPGCEQFEASEGTAVAKQVNDDLSAVVRKYPDRFIGLATLAPQDPVEAAKELNRAVTQLGLKGAKLNSHANGEYLDDKKFWPIFEQAEKLNVPLYFHPAPPSPAISKPYADYGIKLAGPSFGFAADLSLHVMRLIHSGLFDQYPGLKIILGHLGEALPFWLYRIDFTWLKPWVDGIKQHQTSKKPSDCIKDNFFVSTSGMSFFPAFLCTYLALGADRILFASDHPYEDSKHTAEFVESVPICDGDKEKILYINAENLFK